jgi:SAM-dependent methyltransferase
VSYSALETALYQQKRIYHQPLVGFFYRKRLDILLRHAKVSHLTKVLDIGFEHGIFLYKLSKQLQSHNLSGIELNPETYQKTANLFAQTPSLSPIQLLQGNLLTFDFQTKFDVIFATSVLEHILDIEQVGPKIRTLLNPGGRFVVLSPNEHAFYELLRKIFGYTKPHDHYHSAQAITQILGKSLQCIKESYYPWVGQLYKIDVFQ